MLLATGYCFQLPPAGSLFATSLGTSVHHLYSFSPQRSFSGPGGASPTTAQVKVSNGILKCASADRVSASGENMADVADRFIETSIEIVRFF